MHVRRVYYLAFCTYKFCIIPLCVESSKLTVIHIGQLMYIKELRMLRHVTWLMFTSQHPVTSQKAFMFTSTIVRTVCLNLNVETI